MTRREEVFSRVEVAFPGRGVVSVRVPHQPGYPAVRPGDKWVLLSAGEVVGIGDAVAVIPVHKSTKRSRQRRRRGADDVG
jgi:hypothetical protein